MGHPDPPHFLRALGDGEHFGTGDGESTTEVPSELMPHIHFHVSDGGIVCAPGATRGLISHPERPVDFGYGYAD